MFILAMAFFCRINIAMPKKSKKSSEAAEGGDSKPSSAKSEKKISKKMAKLALALSDEEEELDTNAQGWLIKLLTIKSI